MARLSDPEQTTVACHCAQCRCEQQGCCALLRFSDRSSAVLGSCFVMLSQTIGRRISLLSSAIVICMLRPIRKWCAEHACTGAGFPSALGTKRWRSSLRQVWWRPRLGCDTYESPQCLSAHALTTWSRLRPTAPPCSHWTKGPREEAQPNPNPS